MDTERHPLQPFIPDGARLLMLGSFPPARNRWSMDFFYPNFQNDMWRIFGLVFFADKMHFVDSGARTFRLGEIVALLRDRGIAIYDTATEVRRTRNTASDKDLEVVTPTDLDGRMSRMPALETVVTTGGKATALLAAHFGIAKPGVGECMPFRFRRTPHDAVADAEQLEGIPNERGGEGADLRKGVVRPSQLRGDGRQGVAVQA